MMSSFQAGLTRGRRDAARLVEPDALDEAAAPERDAP
jgi:hypothetical protein